MIKPGDQISVWLGAISNPSYWEQTGKDSACPGDAWVAALVLKVLDNGYVVAQRIDNEDHTNKIRPDHWKEFVDDD